MKKLKTKKVQKIRKMRCIEKELWDLCRQIIKERYGTNCYTCPQTNLIGLNWQCGHMHPKGACGAIMRYDLRILRPQCFQCNINHGGMGAAYKRNMEKEIGRAAADKLFLECMSSKAKLVNARDYYTSLIIKYKKLLIV